MQVHAALIPCHSPNTPAHQPTSPFTAPLPLCPSHGLLQSSHCLRYIMRIIFYASWTAHIPRCWLDAAPCIPMPMTHLHVVRPAFAMSLHISTLSLAKPCNAVYHHILSPCPDTQRKSGQIIGCISYVPALIQRSMHHRCSLEGTCTRVTPLCCDMPP
jgi:hypothetical protein